MKVVYTKSFIKDINCITDKVIHKRLKATILEIESSSNLNGISNIKYLVNSGSYYRIRLGDFRIGIKLEDSIVRLIRFLHRKDIYNRFP
jgi:mRNA interferase RelE/StbE